MRDAQVTGFQVDDNGLFRYTRNSWRSAGVDNFISPPGQNPDRFLQLTNILSPQENVLLRRWGYRSFKPQLDTGANASSDEHTPSANASAVIKAGLLFDYENNTLDNRTLIATAGDGTGANSLTNSIVYWDASGVAQTIFTPSVGARTPRMVNSRDYAFFVDGFDGDQQKWSPTIGLEKWGIAAPTTSVTIGTPTGGGALQFVLSAAANAAGGNTVYTGVSLDLVLANTYVSIAGFANTANNGTFKVISSTPTTITVANPSGVAETLAALLSTTNLIYPTVTLNGWAANAHVGSYELGSDQAFNFGLNPGVTLPYVSPGNAIDGNESTFAYAAGQHTHQYYGCVYSFAALASTVNNITLNVLSEVPTTGTDGYFVSQRSGGVYYSVDSGTTWTQLYDTVPYPKQWAKISLNNGQDLSKVQVMVFTDSHDDMYHKVYEINVQGTTVGNGPVTVFSGRRYYQVFGNSTTGHLSDLSPISVSTNGISGGAIPLSGLATSSDPQVDITILLATADGGSPAVLYFLAQLANGTTVYQDGTPEADLLLANTYLFTDDSGNEFGVTDNTPPPNGDFPTKHLGRLFMIQGEFVVFSKNLSELVTNTGIIAGRYEECWPVGNQLDISESAEVGTGLLSDGQTLYVGTSRHVRRITGDSAANFSAPQVVFNEVGVLSQNAWDMVYAEGQPIGSAWITPDFRVVLSDFNTYIDIGTPIQTTLNSTNRAATSKIWSNYFDDGVYSFYILALPTGVNTSPDTLCVYDLKLKEWFIWQCADAFLYGMFYFNLAGVPRWMLVDSNGKIRLFDKTTSDDRAGDTIPVNITHTIQTTWLDLGQITWPNTGDSTIRKAINELEVETDVLTTAITIDGASTAQQFEVPNNVVTNASLIQGTFGEYKVFLVGFPTHDRFYRLTFSGTSVTGTSSANDVLLGSYSLLVRPIHRF